MRKLPNKSLLLSLLLALATLPLLAAGQQQRKPSPPLSTPQTQAATSKTPSPSTPVATAATPPGTEACAQCHSAIAVSYSQTAMAHASGQAIDQLIPADFTHSASGVHYRVYAENNAAMLAFDRPDDPTMRGTRRLQYFIGSGHRGRTYLFSLDDFFFESPINWYAQKKVWDTAPAFQDAKFMPMNLPAYPGCLNCHTSASRAPVAGTENKYEMPLFAHDGITCERCHGENAAHIATGKGEIVNPSKLAPARRDDVCMQCHLEGNVAIEQPHRKLADYHPGENLGDDVHYFIYVDSESQQIRALGQSEALWQSVCKLKSGDKMTCTT
ncbi:MAG TPA: multiheme c-type cytochrome, partial [Candidatus Acidoferrum sp.]|nr:multiheme c-type cytochrome [Candidatus Acidoferrum sp.]